jgi:hypothetical protein
MRAVTAYGRAENTGLLSQPTISRRIERQVGAAILAAHLHRNNRAEIPSPAPREREGPAKREGEGRAACDAAWRLARLTLIRLA